MLIGSRPDETQKTVLIIDDEEQNFFSLAAWLGTRGFRCYSASNTAEALSVLRDHPGVKAILMDVMMPGIDGYEATRAIKAEPGWNHIPIIALTALVGKEARDKALAAGADGFLNKPVDPDHLLDWLNQHIA